MALTGWPVKTLLGGKVVFSDGAVVGSPSGRFLKRPALRNG
jgi:dihydroorotase-like cyclic amidohydrolase